MPIFSRRMCQNFASSVRRVMKEVREGRESQTMPPEKVKSKRPFTVAVEGNIGSGKSTFLEHFEQYSSQVELLLQVVPRARQVFGRSR